MDRLARPRSGTGVPGLTADASTGLSPPVPRGRRGNVALARRPAERLADQPARQVLDVHHAARIIEQLAKQRQARDAGGIEGPQQLPHRLVLVDGDDVGARHHHVDHVQCPEAQDAQEHLALLGGEGAAVARALQRVLDHDPQRRRTRQSEPRAQRCKPALRMIVGGSASGVCAPLDPSLICLTLMARKDQLSNIDVSRDQASTATA